MNLDFERFETWVRDRARGCMEQDEIDELCQGGFDVAGDWYSFVNPVVQAQWEAWQASGQSASAISSSDEQLDMSLVNAAIADIESGRCKPTFPPREDL